MLLEPLFTFSEIGVKQMGWAESFWHMLSPPEDISVNGHLIDWLFYYTTYLNLFFFGLVCVGLFGFSYLYAHKRHPKAYYSYGNKKIHIIVVTLIGIVVFLSLDLNITRVANNDFTRVFINWPKEGPQTVRIQVLAQQWMWNFRYAGKDGLFNTEDDITTVNDLKLPIGKKILFQILSKDVIHSFYLPNARQKVDAIPGRITRMWVQFKKTGLFDIACAEMCGTYHYKMAAKLTLYNQQDFEYWMGQSHNIILATGPSQSADDYWGWKWK